jgi:uncharacterized protein YeaO (DUF488 family)
VFCNFSLHQPGFGRQCAHVVARVSSLRRRTGGENPDASRPILNAAQRGNVALVYSSHDAEHNNAVVLKEYVEEKLEKKSNPPRKSAA